jgi:predicted glycoside hydrolase/deacetylase ChbG (UPF0249 family)
MEENGRIRFRKDLRESNDIVYDEILVECLEQIDRCVRIMGRAPDTGIGAFGGTPFSKAVEQVCDEYGIARNFMRSAPVREGDRPSPFKSVQDEKWSARKLYSAGLGNSFQDLMTDSITELEKYDPAGYYINDVSGLLDFKDDDYVMTAWHPGYVDHFVYRLGDYGPMARNFILARVMDSEALCSDRLRKWIKDNKVELVNTRDALYGTNEYQNHLKAIGSDLAVY